VTLATLALVKSVARKQNKLRVCISSECVGGDTVVCCLVAVTINGNRDKVGSDSLL